MLAAPFRSVDDLLLALQYTGEPISHPNAATSRIRLQYALDVLQAPCFDGIDNDLDGMIDFGDDIGCFDPAWPEENPACQDGMDNDPASDDGTDFDGGASLNEGVPLEEPDPECPYGARGVGEIGLVPTAPVISPASSGRSKLWRRAGRSRSRTMAPLLARPMAASM